MRKLLILFAVLLLASMAVQGTWYPMQIGTNKAVQSYGGGTDYAGQVVIQTIPAAETSDTDQIMAARVNDFNATTKFVLTTTGAGSSTFLAQPDVPRNVIATMNATATCAMKLTGTDISGAVITENLTWAGETGAKASLKAFKTITRIDATSSATVVQAIIGTGNVLGLNSYLPRNTVLLEYVNGARETTAGTVTTSSTVLSLNTIDTYTAPGGYVTVVYYVLNS